MLAPLGFVISGVHHPVVGLDDRLEVGVAILIGYLILGVSRGLHLNDQPTVLDCRAAAWLPV